METISLKHLINVLDILKYEENKSYITIDELLDIVRCLNG